MIRLIAKFSMDGIVHSMKTIYQNVSSLKILFLWIVTNVETMLLMLASIVTMERKMDVEIVLFRMDISVTELT